MTTFVHLLLFPECEFSVVHFDYMGCVSEKCVLDGEQEFIVNSPIELNNLEL